MTERRAGICLCMLCALVVSAFVAQAANAAGTTAYTCKNTGAGGTFKAGHCKPSDAGSGNFSSVAVTEKTELSAQDLNTAGEHTGAILKSTIAGSAVELVATSVSGTGTMENSEVGGEMRVSGEGKLVFSGVTEKLLGCKVTGKPGGVGVVETKQLFASTAGVGSKVKFTPKEGTLFAEFELTECAVGPTTVKVVGSVLDVPEGSTFNTTHATVTEEKTLRLGSAVGPVAGISKSITIRIRSSGGSFIHIHLTF